MNKNKTLTNLQQHSMTVILVLVFIFFAWSTGGKILMPQNISNLFAQNAYVFILATGMLLCIITGGNIDLSVGSVVCFTGAVGALLMSQGVNMWVAVAVMLAIGLIIGAFQAFFIAYLNIPSFITTLAGQLVFRGLANVILGGKTCAVDNDSFLKIFGGGAECYIPDPFGIEGINLLCIIVGILSCLVYVAYTLNSRFVRIKKGYTVEGWLPAIGRMIVVCGVIGFFFAKLSQYKGIPTALIWVVLVVAAYAYLSSKTNVGRYLYATGGNEKATKLSGIDTRKIKFFAHTSMGFLAGLAGIMTIARMCSAQPTYGTGYEMDAISACFIGGASAYGGTGKVSGVIIGAVLMGVINIGMTIMGIDQNYQKVVKGAVLLAAVIFDVLSKRHNAKTA